MSLATSLYNSVFRRNSTFVASIFASAFVLDSVMDISFQKFWDSQNAGKQWKDIRHQYVEAEDDE
ncbi:ubiquinol-cytochrome C reductase [Dipodascopsis tothii]|uniref:ubiquinol-cytochrome C reductase n=1 Tax=Dipodascopsis tothii TaxID=44089 RepID=UPI0034CE4D25